jgi:hypothetical protein
MVGGAHPCSAAWDRERKTTGNIRPGGIGYANFSYVRILVRTIYKDGCEICKGCNQSQKLHGHFE